MAKLVLKILVIIISGVLFFYTIFQVPYPSSLTSANPYQLIFFFIPLFLGLTSLFFLKFNLLGSGSLALGIIILLVLKAFDSLNLATILLDLVATFLLFSYFKNLKAFSLKKSKARTLPKKPKQGKLTHKL